MKKTITLLFILLTFITGFSQILPNPDFEVWEDFTGYEDPESWDTPNSFTSLAGVTVVSKSEDAYSGMYSALLETKTVFGANVSPGLLTLADFVVDLTTGQPSFLGGIALSDRVIKLTGQYKYSGADGDSARVFMISFKHPEGGSKDTLGIGLGYLHNAEDWTEFTVNMLTFSPVKPDTFNVIIQSSSDVLHVGSTLYIDDLSLETITGIFNLSERNNEIKVYPNPVSDLVKFEMENRNDNMKLSVFDNTGREVITETFNSNTIELSMGTLPTGVYSYRVGNAGKLLGSGSFIKE